MSAEDSELDDDFESDDQEDEDQEDEDLDLEDASLEADDHDAVPLRVLQEAGGSITVSLAGRDGRPGTHGRDGRPGRMGRLLKNGGRTAGGNGASGTNGRRGTHGRHGRSATLGLRVARDAIVLSGPGVQEYVSGTVVVDARGGDGGNGGSGGRGGSGGYGSPSGRDGSHGTGADGCDGGDGGDIVITTEDAHVLAVVSKVLVAGGRAGSGGSGSPSGSDGSPGRDGTVVLRAWNAKTGEHEEDEVFGVIPERLTTESDDRINGHLTRGSHFSIEKVVIANPTDISILAPYAIAFSVDSTVEIPEPAFEIDSVDLLGSETTEAPCRIAARVRPGSDIGWFEIRTAVVSMRAGIHLHLNLGRQDGTAKFSVNHRLVEAEIAVDEASRAALRTFLDRFNGMPPEEQTSLSTATLLRQMAGARPIAAMRRDTLSSMLEGKLLRPNELWGAFDMQTFEQSLVLSCALHFFRALSLDARTKALDATYFVASEDGVLEPSEKATLISIAKGMAVPDEWLVENMPRLFQEGSSSATASRSNWAGSIALPFIVGAIFLVAAWTLSTLSPVVALTSIAFSLGIHLSLYLAVATLAVLPLRRLLFRAACGSCGSLDLREVTLEKRKATLLGTADAYRCADCGARGNRIAEDANELACADCPVEPDAGHTKTFVALGVAAVGVVLAALFLPAPCMPALIPAGAGTVLLVLLSLGGLRTWRRASVAPFVAAFLLGGGGVAVTHGAGVSAVRIPNAAASGAPAPSTVPAPSASVVHSPSAPPHRSASGRYAVAECGAISDTKTNLDWFVGPDRDTSFADASSWVAQLATCGAAKWRLPSAGELAGLFDSHQSAGSGFTLDGKAYTAKIDAVFGAIGGGAWVWTSKEAGPTQAAVQNLYLNQTATIAKDLSGAKVPYAVRAFAVRAAHADNDGSDAARPVLAPKDQGFVDGRGGAGWGDRCWINLKAGKLGWAKAECQEGMKLDPASPNPRASLLYNLGLIEKKAGNAAAARPLFEQSLALREHPDVRAALDGL